MNRILALLLALTLLFTAAISLAEEETFENPVYSEDFIRMQEKKLEMVPKIIPKTILNIKKGYEDDPFEKQYGGFTFITEVKPERAELTVVADTISETESYGRGWQYYEKTGSQSNFYMSIGMQFVEAKGNTEAKFFFQYTNGVTVGEENRSSVEIFFPGEIEKYITVPSGTESEDGEQKHERVYTKFYDLSSEYLLDNERHVLEMIRFYGYTSCYIDHHFVAGFEDGFDDEFYPIFGVSIEPGGESATFAVDSFVFSVAPENKKLETANSICLANKVNVRTEPSQSGKSIGQIGMNEPISILQDDGEWSLIDSAVGQGYVKSQYVLQLQ